MKNKEYKYDDNFKALARAHQIKYKEEILKDYYIEKYPQVILSPESSKKGLIFCSEYRDLIHSKIKKFETSPLFSNMLRSEHIPYNIFTPMEEDKDNTRLLFKDIIGDDIIHINNIIIEFAGSKDKSLYPNDRTSFDAYIEYKCNNGRNGGIGIEVKYTENGYKIGNKEKKDIENPNGLYRIMTSKSGYFKNDFDIKTLIKADHIRQIWRNHLLGFAMINNNAIDVFHHIHLYPRNNSHFHNFAIPEYKKILSRKGKESFIAITYEDLFSLLRKYFVSEKQIKWINYLTERYII